MELRTSRVTTATGDSSCRSTQRDNRINCWKAVFTWNRQKVKAIQMRKKFFGNDYYEMENGSLHETCLDWPPIKPEDGAALQSFELFLTSCSNTMIDINSMDKLDLASNIKALVNKLPYKLKEAWIERLHNISHLHNTSSLWEFGLKNTQGAIKGIREQEPWTLRM